MKAIYKQVTKNSYVRTVSALADEIWHECYLRVIPGRPLNALLAQLQSADAIDEAIHDDGVNYFLIQLAGKDVGYFSFSTTTGGVCLEKLYLRKAARGQGLGRDVVTYVEKLAEGEGKARVFFSIPQKCLESVAFFKHRGYRPGAVSELPLEGGGGLAVTEMEKMVHF